MIKITKKEHAQFKDIYQVIQARSTDTIKPVFYHVYVDEGGTLIATDSRRMHYTETDLDPGFYEVVKCTKSEIILVPAGDIGQFPNWKQVAPDEKKLNTRDEYKKEEGFDFTPFKPRLSRNYTDIVRCMPSTVTINIEFIEKLDGAADVYINVEGKGMAPLVVKFKTWTAVIMPIKISD